MAKLTYQQRKKLPEGEFIYPSKNAYPIPDASHARSALQRVSQFGTTSEKEKVRREVHKKFPGIEIKKKGKD